MQSLQSAAEGYGKMGWPIFPLLPCSKKPGTPDGFKSATNDPGTIATWWQNGTAEANIGLHCRGLLVLDADGLKGRESLAKLEAAHGKLPDTLRQRTPRDGGGTHFLFGVPPHLAIPNSAGKVGVGLDVRGEDGYIVIAPSIHPDTKTEYCWDTPDGEAVGHDIAECPQWLLELALKAKEKPAAVKQSDPADTTDDSDIIPEGERHCTMMSEAGVNARRFRNDPDLVSAIVHRINDTRCEPPLPDDEIETIIADAIKYADDEEPDPVIRIARPSNGKTAAAIGEESDEDKIVIPPGAHILTVEEMQERMDRDEAEAASDSTEIALRDIRDVWAEWGLRTSQAGKDGPISLKPNLYNAVGLLTKDPDWCNSVYWNQFAIDLAFSRDVPRLKAKAGDKVEDTTFTLLTYELQADSEAEFSKTTVIDALVCAGQQRAIHPVREYLSDIRWDNEPRIDRWLTDLLGAPDKPLTHAFAARWLIAGVSRIFRPGCKMDTALILEGAEGIRKSSTFEELCPDPAWFSDDVGDFTKVDTVLCLRGKWIVEMGELTSLARHEVEIAKAFIARKTDVYRVPYGRVPKDWPRQFVLSGSTNRSSGYLLEADGHRRFWPTTVTGVAPGLIASLRDQLWAEAVTRYRKGERWWLDADKDPELVKEAAANVDLRVVEHPWAELIGARAAGEKVGVEITADEILTLWIFKDRDKLTEGDALKVGRIMSKLRWEKERKRYPGSETQYTLYRKMK